MVMTPDGYRGELRKAKEFLKEVDLFLEGKTDEGKKIAIVTEDDFEALIEKCNQWESELTVLIKGLKTNSKKKNDYEECLEDVLERKSKLKDQRFEFMRKWSKH